MKGSYPGIAFTSADTVPSHNPRVDLPAQPTNRPNLTQVDPGENGSRGRLLRPLPASTGGRPQLPQVDRRDLPGRG